MKRNILSNCVFLKLLIASLILWTAPQAQATQQVLGIKGVITASSSQLPQDAPLGTTVVVQLTYDDTVADNVPGNSEVAQYDLLITTSVAIIGTNSLHQGSLSGNGAIIVRDNVFNGGTVFTDQFQFHSQLMQLRLNGLNLVIHNLAAQLDEISNSPSQTVTSDALPIAPFPLLSGFSTNRTLRLITEDITTGAANEIVVSILEFEEGGSLSTPIIPDSVVTNSDGTVTFAFGMNSVTAFPPSCMFPGCWIDPPSSPSFTYSMNNAALFTSISDFPTGFGSNLDVTVEGTSLGLFGPGDSVDFTGFPNSGVSVFTVSGISPQANLGSVTAFPLKISFDSLEANFTMTSGKPMPIPALGHWNILLGIALLFSSIASVTGLFCVNERVGKLRALRNLPGV